MKRRITLEIIYFLLISLFTYAALIKLLDIARFQGQIVQSTLISSYSVVLSWSVPIVELITVVLLAIKPIRIAGLYCSFILMSAFSIYILIILNYDANIPCSCGGILEKMGWTEHLIFNLTFVILSAGAIVIEGTQKTVSYESSCT